jgi:hypothetical protein
MTQRVHYYQSQTYPGPGKELVKHRNESRPFCIRDNWASSSSCSATKKLYKESYFRPPGGRFSDRVLEGGLRFKRTASIMYRTVWIADQGQ